jgi:hypothetical protein
MTMEPTRISSANWFYEAARIKMAGAGNKPLPGQKSPALAYAAGADAELEACCSFFDLDGQPRVANSLRAARRPKPPSLKQQAIKSLDLLMGDLACLYHDEDHSFHSDRSAAPLNHSPTTDPASSASSSGGGAGIASMAAAS